MRPMDNDAMDPAKKSDDFRVGVDHRVALDIKARKQATPVRLLMASLRDFIHADVSNPHPDRGLVTEAYGLLEELQKRGGDNATTR